MDTASSWPQTPAERGAGWMARGRDWMDERGAAAWITAAVVGFVLFWPIGLAVLLYAIWSRRIMCSRRKANRWDRKLESTGNTAFDNYRAETLKRLEDERDGFVQFLEQLRAAKDQAEFDQFMARRQNT